MVQSIDCVSSSLSFGSHTWIPSSKLKKEELKSSQCRKVLSSIDGATQDARGRQFMYGRIGNEIVGYVLPLLQGVPEVIL